MSAADRIDFPDLSGRVVLLVDDNEDQLDVLLAFFDACRARVLMAREVDIALLYLQNVHVDLLVSGLAVPTEDGLILIRTLRGLGEPQRTIPAIALTRSPEGDAHARSFGFDAFLQKPVDPTHLARVIRGVLEFRNDSTDGEDS